MSWNSVEIDVTTYSDEAKKKIKGLDLSVFGLEKKLSFSGGKYHCKLEDVDDFVDDLDDEFSGPFLMMRAFADALGSEGKATIILKDLEWENDFHTCLVYYYLGDEIKLRVFFDEETGCYDFHDFMSVLLDLETTKLEDIVAEMDLEVDTEEDYDESELNGIIFDDRYHLVFNIAHTLGYYDFYQSKENITRSFDGPKVAALFDLIDKLKAACCFSFDELESGEFKPEQSWEEKGIAVFSGKEKETLLKNGAGNDKPAAKKSKSKKKEFNISGNTLNKYLGDEANVIIPDGVESIGPDAFYHCCGIKSIKIPDSVKDIDMEAFRECTSLTEINIPNGVDGLWLNTFLDCKSLPRILIPESVKLINISAFSGCTSLSEINIPEGVTMIGENAFRDCASLTEITIPASVTEIGRDAFTGCEQLTVTVSEGSYTEKYCKENGLKYQYR